MEQPNPNSLTGKTVRDDEIVSTEIFEALGDDGVASGAPKSSDTPVWRTVLTGGLQTILVVAVLVVGWSMASWLTGTAPKPDRKARERVARLVEVVPVTTQRQAPVIRGWGEVRPARTLIVRPEVSGTLTYVNPEVTAGGLLRAGDVAAQIDDRDLKLAVARARSDVARIEARIIIEQGQAAIGQRDLARRGNNLTEEQQALILRRPQMAQLEAELLSAQADLEQTEIGLARTAYRMPFDAVVLDESIAQGTTVSVGSEVARLAAVDLFHIVVAVPSRALQWVPEEGGKVTITQPGVWPEGASREGTIVRIASALSTTGRMAEVIVEVEDPLALRSPGAPRLLLGAVVEASLEGNPIDDSVVLPRAFLREDEAVWVMSDENKLDIRAVEVGWRDSESVLITAGLEDGDMIVTTPLATYAPGMALRTGEARQ